MPKTSKIIAENVRRLMEHQRIKQSELGKRTHISQRTISNLLNPESQHSTTLDIIERLADYFGLEIYHLLIPNLPTDELLNRSIEQIVDCYAHLPIDGRDNIRHAALDITKLFQNPRTSTMDRRLKGRKDRRSTNSIKNSINNTAEKTCEP